MIAPNLIAVVGTAVAAQLIVHAGGIHNLSRMPSCNIQVVVSKVDAYFQQVLGNRRKTSTRTLATALAGTTSAKGFSSHSSALTQASFLNATL
jgi:hypothetical protein